MSRRSNTRVLDSNDGLAVMEDLCRRVNTTLGEVAGQAWKCLGAIPRIDGSLYFELRHHDGDARLNWIGPPTSGGREGQRLEWIETRSPIAGTDRVAAAVDAVLARLLDMPEYFLLDFYNRDLPSLRFDDDVVDILLAGRFTPGQTRWSEYRFCEPFQESSEVFRMKFEGPAGPVEFEIRRAPAEGTESDPLFSNRFFVLDLVHDSRRKSDRRLLHHQVERFLGFLLSRAVNPDMGLERTSRPDFDVSAGPDEPTGPVMYDGGPTSTTRWGNPRQWFQFFSDFEIERSSLCSMRFTDPVCCVTHGEHECMSIEPDTCTPTVVFVNLPWVDSHGAANDVRSESSGFFTGMVDSDTIMGGTAKLENALRAAIQNPRTRMVRVNNTCLPKIIGDDVNSVIARVQKESPIPILLMNTDLNSPEATFTDLVRQARQVLDEQKPDERTGGLNLIGFPPGRGRSELQAELERVGIGVNVWLFPAIGVESMRRYLAGRYGIVYPHAIWLELAENILAELGVEYRPLPAPHGLERTARWLQKVAEVLDQTLAWEKWRARFLEPRRAEWDDLTRQAGEHGLAFVVDIDSAGRLKDAGSHYGFEILPLLEEMGFRLYVFVRQPSSGPTDQTGTEVMDSLAQPQRHTCSFFSEPDELSELLRADGFEAVYSEVFFDTRISRAGKAQFNLSMIELGLDGAFRSLGRLIGLCRWPFYRSYHRYLGRKDLSDHDGPG